MNGKTINIKNRQRFVRGLQFWLQNPAALDIVSCDLKYKLPSLYLLYVRRHRSHHKGRWGKEWREESGPIHNF